MIACTLRAPFACLQLVCHGIHPGVPIVQSHMVRAADMVDHAVHEGMPGACRVQAASAPHPEARCCTASPHTRWARPSRRRAGGDRWPHAGRVRGGEDFHRFRRSCQHPAWSSGIQGSDAAKLTRAFTIFPSGGPELKTGRGGNPQGEHALEGCAGTCRHRKLHMASRHPIVRNV